MGIRIIRFIRLWSKLDGLVGLREGREKLQVPPLRYPGFPVEFVGVDRVHAPFFTERRIGGLLGAAW
jgi:hypothetical protein